MNELSIEEKAKAYDANYKTYIELINRLEDIKNAIKKQNYGIAMDILCKPYPEYQITTSTEIKESDDESIRKALIHLISEQNGFLTAINGISIKDIIAWLERQIDKDKLSQELGEHNVKYTQEVLKNHLNIMNKDDERLRKTTIGFLKDFADQGYENAVECIDWLEKWNEPVEHVSKEDMGCLMPNDQSSDKIESKFHVGDWIVKNDGKDSFSDGSYVLQITDITDTTNINDIMYKKYKLSNGCYLIEPFANSYRHWTLQDAKDSDVLVCESGKRTLECLFIFKLIADREVHEYCSYRTIDKHFSPKDSFLGYVDNVYHPATKEQHDLLFQKIKEAGYEWDAEKKELKKIEPKFKVGDWIVYNRNDESSEIIQVYDIRDDRYYFTDSFHFSWSIKECDERAHLWTIEDVKNGDVLFDGSNILLVKELNNWHNVTSYLAYSQVYSIREHFISSSDIITPATKKQRDLLFKKMKEADYEWDVDNKELKKIEKPYPETLDQAIELYYYTYGNDKGGFDNLSLEKFKGIVKLFVDDYSMPKQEWSEEDENEYNHILKTINLVAEEQETKGYNNLISSVNWFKSLKERVQLQSKQE